MNLRVPRLRVVEQEFSLPGLEVKSPRVDSEHVGSRIEIEQCHAFSLGKPVGRLVAPTRVTHADSIAHLRDHSRAALDDSSQDFLVNRRIGGGQPTLVTGMNVRDGRAGVVRILHRLNNLFRLLGQCGIRLLAVQAPGGRDGNDDLFKAGYVRFHDRLLMSKKFVAVMPPFFRPCEPLCTWLRLTVDAFGQQRGRDFGGRAPHRRQETVSLLQRHARRRPMHGNCRTHSALRIAHRHGHAHRTHEILADIGTDAAHSNLRQLAFERRDTGVCAIGVARERS